MKNKAYIILSSFLLLIPLFISLTAIQGKGEAQSPPIRIQAAGDLVWSFVTGNVNYTCPAIDYSGNIYFGSRDNKFYSLTSSGTFRWSHDVSEVGYDIQINSSPAIDSSQNIYFGTERRDAVPNSYPSRFYSLDSNGSFRWSYVPTHIIHPGPAIDDSGNIIFGTNDNRLYCLNSSGSLQWSFNSGDDIACSVSIAPDGTIYFGIRDPDNRVYALNSNGTFKWSFVAPYKIEASIAIDASGNIYFGCDDFDTAIPAVIPNFFSLDSSGNFRWSLVTTGDFEQGPAIDCSGNVYFCNEQDSTLFVFNTSGSFQWSFTTNNDFGFSTPAIGNDGLIYVGNNNDRLFCLNSSGVLQWSYDTNGNVAHPAIAGNGNIYVGGGSALFAFDSASSNLADCPWPKFGHDMQNTHNQSTATLAELAYFRGKHVPSQSKIIVEWKTETELETYGFYLLRKERENGTYFPVNSCIFLAQGDSMTGAEYSYEDYDVREGTTYDYLLEEIDLYGASNYYGPISVSTKKPSLIDKERTSRKIR